MSVQEPMGAVTAEQPNDESYGHLYDHSENRRAGEEDFQRGERRLLLR